MVFCGESIITEISVYVSFYMSEFIIQSTQKKIRTFVYLECYRSIAFFDRAYYNI